jgi:hypothetical protein
MKKTTCPGERESWVLKREIVEGFFAKWVGCL